MTRRELFKLVAVSASTASGEPTVTVPGGEMRNVKADRPIREWGELIDALSADVPVGTYARLETVFKRTNAQPARYEVDYVLLQATVPR
jgi:hypothetical protein